MEHLTDLKAILHSKRANIYYIEKCRVLMKDGRVVYLTETKSEFKYWNIPIANTTVILLGMGTSITQAAVRMLASAGVLIGFSGTGGTPLISGNEIEWINPQSEYRPTEYVQGWMGFWFDDEKRLKAAKYLQNKRLGFIEKIWSSDSFLEQNQFYIDDLSISTTIKNYRGKIATAKSVNELLQTEALLTRILYKYAAEKTDLSGFTRDRDSSDTANKFLNHGNYLAYGLAATTLWVLGIPHGFALMHGKTRKGALVFDIADLFKDAIILPLAFIYSSQNFTEQEFRDQCIISFTKHKVLDFLFKTTKEISLKQDWN
ncbi:MAG: type I-F CRISPR-associated endonuclease Cas1f [Candidatus Cloacimonetes bacterium]|nr:type I-F CRISPR-associated endonuclease Cas1f [Candidatus Cloacimonadota bacterium]